ncbi:hypothetical protein DFS34DRAFT_611896 [Phlyctochytrium arcticum]|nr:hypothetical protein DFS34DRAFT_611896 [Phlyctochytrium arcticum]
MIQQWFNLTAVLQRLPRPEGGRLRRDTFKAVRHIYHNDKEILGTGAKGFYVRCRRLHVADVQQMMEMFNSRFHHPNFMAKLDRIVNKVASTSTDQQEVYLRYIGTCTQPVDYKNICAALPCPARLSYVLTKWTPMVPSLRGRLSGRWQSLLGAVRGARKTRPTNGPKRILISLFGYESLINVQRGGFYGLYEPSQDEEILFPSLETNVINTFNARAIISTSPTTASCFPTLCIPRLLRSIFRVGSEPQGIIIRSLGLDAERSKWSDGAVQELFAEALTLRTNERADVLTNLTPNQPNNNDPRKPYPPVGPQSQKCAGPTNKHLRCAIGGCFRTGLQGVMGIVAHGPDPPPNVLATRMEVGCILHHGTVSRSFLTVSRIRKSVFKYLRDQQQKRQPTNHPTNISDQTSQLISAGEFFLSLSFWVGGRAVVVWQKGNALVCACHFATTTLLARQEILSTFDSNEGLPRGGPKMSAGRPCTACLVGPGGRYLLPNLQLGPCTPNV